MLRIVIGEDVVACSGGDFVLGAVIEPALDGSECLIKGKDIGLYHVEGTAIGTHTQTPRRRIEECVAILNVWSHTGTPLSILFSPSSQIAQTVPCTAYRSLSVSAHLFSFSSRIKALSQSLRPLVNALRCD